MSHAPALLRTAVRLSRRRCVAEELVQETLLLAWKSFDQFELGTNCKAWVFTIMWHLWKRQRPRNSFDLSLEAKEIAAPFASARFAMEERILMLEVLEQIDGLPEEQRVVLLLSVVEGFPIAEIAQVLEIPAGTVMSRLGRARAALRQFLQRPATKRARSAGM